MMAPKGAANTKRNALHLDLRTALLASATLALIAIDLSHLTIATGAGALVLAAFVVAYLSLPRLQEPQFALYGLIIAELSPISVQADLVTAVVYQALCVLFLTALISPFPRLSKLGTYAKPALLTLLIAAASLAPGLALARWLGVTATQAASVSGALLLLAVLVVLRVTRNDTHVQTVLEA